MRTVFFSVGEPSGDLHGANLIRSLRQFDPDICCVGYGGPRMQSAGCDLHEDLTRFAVMWIAKVIAHLPTFLRLLRRADRFFRQQTPSAVVLIDYPGFNWWIARRAKAHGIPVFYYGTPQLWAWAGWRIKKMRRLTDHVLCKLPFEETWFRDRGCNAHYVGHPYFDELASRALDKEFVAHFRAHGDGPLLTLLPGSRDQEVATNLPVLMKTAAIVKQRVEGLRIAVASFNQPQEITAQQCAKEFGTAFASIHVGRTAELIHLSDCCLACSGSVSLELMHHRKPAVIHYKIDRFAYALQDRFRTARFITLVNLLAAESITRAPGERICGSAAEPFPEFLTWKDESSAMAQAVLQRLQDRALRESIERQLGQLCDKYGQPGASRRAALYLIQQLGSPAAEPLEPNFTKRRRRVGTVI
jgi:lipid-A-disaccharide synthase